MVLRLCVGNNGGNNGVKGCVGTMVLKAFNGVKGFE